MPGRPMSTTAASKLSVRLTGPRSALPAVRQPAAGQAQRCPGRHDIVFHQQSRMILASSPRKTGVAATTLIAHSVRRIMVPKACSVRISSSGIAARPSMMCTEDFTALAGRVQLSPAMLGQHAPEVIAVGKGLIDAPRRQIGQLAGLVQLTR